MSENNSTLEEATAGLTAYEASEASEDSSSLLVLSSRASPEPPPTTLRSRLHFHRWRILGGLVVLGVAITFLVFLIKGSITHVVFTVVEAIHSLGPWVSS
jgi:hypothetical protein